MAWWQTGDRAGGKPVTGGRQAGDAGGRPRDRAGGKPRVRAGGKPGPGRLAPAP